MWILGNGIQQAVSDVQCGSGHLSKRVLSTLLRLISALATPAWLFPPPFLLSSISSLCFLHLRRYAVGKYISLTQRNE